jgi:hypothetical protein
MWAMSVVMLDVLLQYQVQVTGSGDQEMVKALSAQCADPAFGDRIRPRCPDGGAEDGDVGAGEDRVEGGGEFAVAIADQEPKLLGTFAEVHQQVAGLLGHPGAGGG